jgi:4-hydroxy-2-oxoheptanedioate aldolase
VAEVLAAAGLDLLIADLEHSSLSIRELEGIIRAAHVHRCPVIARLTLERLTDAGHAIEAGVDGIQVSGVSEADQLLAIREATSFPPDGRLGLSLSHRAAGFGAMTARDYAERVADQLVIAQIESAAAIAALEQLLATPRRPDIWFLGPMDLSADLGCPGEANHPAVRAALERAVQTFTAAGVAFGVFATDIDDTEQWRRRGAALVVVGSDMSLLAATTRSMADRWRSETSPAPR